MVETVDSSKLAKEIDKGLQKLVDDAGAVESRHLEIPLRVLVQVNTSSEDCPFSFRNTLFLLW